MDLRVDAGAVAILALAPSLTALALAAAPTHTDLIVISETCGCPPPL
jgi:hypothetical protein